MNGRVLDGEQKKELEEVLGKYSELFSGKPGKTKIDQHVIHTGMKCLSDHKHIEFLYIGEKNFGRRLNMC